MGTGGSKNQGTVNNQNSGTYTGTYKDGTGEEETGTYEDGTGTYEDGTGEEETGTYQDGTGTYEDGTGTYEDGTGEEETGTYEDGTGEEETNRNTSQRTNNKNSQVKPGKEDDESSSEDSVTEVEEPVEQEADKNNIGSQKSPDPKKRDTKEMFSTLEKENPTYQSEDDGMQIIQDQIAQKQMEDSKPNTPRQEEFKKAAGIYKVKEDKYDINPDIQKYKPKPPEDEIGMLGGLGIGGLDSRKQLSNPTKYKKIKEDKSGNIVKKKIETPRQEDQKIQEQPKKIESPIKIKNAEWDIIDPNKNKNPIRNDKELFEKNHEYNNISDGGDIQDEFERMRNLQDMHRHREEAKKEFNNLISKHIKNKNRSKKVTRNTKSSLDDMSRDTLNEEDFDPNRRDQIRRNIKNLLKNNFKVGNRKRNNRNVKRLAEREQRNLKNRDFRKKSNGKNKTNPFMVDSDTKLRGPEMGNMTKVRGMKEAVRMDDIKRRFKRKVVRRRSEVDIQTDLYSEGKNQGKKGKEKNQPKIVSSGNQFLDNLIEQKFSNDKNYKRIGDNYYDLDDMPKNAFKRKEDLQKSFYNKIPKEAKENPTSFANNFREEKPDKSDNAYKKDVEGGKESLAVYIDFMLDGPDGMGWRTYKFKVEKYKGQVIDLKILIERDFGYLVSDQLLFYNFRVIDDDHMLVASLVKSNDIWTKGQLTLIFVPRKDPTVNVTKVIRTKLTPIELSKVYPTGGAFCANTAEFLESNLTKVLVFPPNRDWTKEYYINRFRIEDLHKRIEEKTSQIEYRGDVPKVMDKELSDLLSLNQNILKTRKEFEMTAKKCVELINKWKIKEHDVRYLYGTGSKKYILGGMVIRECEWLYAFRRRYDDSINLEKILKHKVKMMNYIRKKQSEIKVPLVTMISYFGVHYIVYALSPIDFNSLVYGTFTQNLLIADNLNDLPILSKLSQDLNCSFHSVTEFATGSLKQIYLSTGLEIHRCDGSLYLTDVERLTPLEIKTGFNFRNADKNFKKFVKFMPLNMVFLSQEKEIDSMYMRVMSNATVKCNECEEYIPDEEYFKYEKSNIYFKALKAKKYYCCLNCYRTKSLYHQLEVPISRLKKKKFRGHTLGDFYINKHTGKICKETPFRKIPLNPDAILYVGRILVKGQRPNRIVKDFIKENERDLKTIEFLITQDKDLKINEVLFQIESFEEEVCSGKDLSKALKKSGLALRTMGKMASLTTKHYVKELLAREMVARATSSIMKNSFLYLRKVSSSKMNEYSLKKSMTYHMNNIFGAGNREDNDTEWKTIIDFVNLKFDCKLEEIIKEKLHLPSLACRICEILGVTLNVKVSDINLEQEQPFLPHFFSFQIPHIVISFDVDFSLKYLSFLGKKYFNLGKVENWWIITGDDVKVGLFYFTQAAEFCKILYGTNDPLCIKYLFHKATAMEKKHCERGRPEFSIWNKAEKVKEDIYSAEARFCYNKILQIFYDRKLPLSNIIPESYIGLARLVKDNKYELIQIDNSDKFNSEEDARIYYLKKAAMAYESISGNVHPLVGETFSKISLRHKELFNERKSLVWMRKALCVFQSTLGSDDEVTDRCYRYLIRMEQNIGTKYRKFGLDQLAFALMENCDEDFDEGEEVEVYEAHFRPLGKRSQKNIEEDSMRMIGYEDRG